MPSLQVLLIFVGIPLLVITTVSLLVLIPSWVKGPRYRPGQPWDAESEWFGAQIATAPARRVERLRRSWGRTPLHDETSRRRECRVVRPSRTRSAMRSSGPSPKPSACPGGCSPSRSGPRARQTRAYAEALHARLPDPDRSILVQVDPERRTLEIVTGELVRRVLDNRGAALGAVTMQSPFAAGDLTRGLMAGSSSWPSCPAPPRTCTPTPPEGRA